MEPFSHEIEVMATCLEQFDSLTPEARERALDWLADRVRSDIVKGVEAAHVVVALARLHA